jgi:hypothetical protein
MEVAVSSTPALVTTSHLDSLLEKVLAARTDYAEKDRVAKEANHVRKDLEKQFLDALLAVGKTTWKIDGLGTVSVVDNFNVPVAKTIEDKRDLWGYIAAKYGEDVAFDKFGMHSKTLNSFYKAELEIAEDKSLFSLPGIGEPTHEKEFRFRKA